MFCILYIMKSELKVMQIWVLLKDMTAHASKNGGWHKQKKVKFYSGLSVTSLMGCHMHRRRRVSLKCDVIKGCCKHAIMKNFNCRSSSFTCNSHCRCARYRRSRPCRGWPQRQGDVSDTSGDADIDRVSSCWPRRPKAGLGSSGHWRADKVLYVGIEVSVNNNNNNERVFNLSSC